MQKKKEKEIKACQYGIPSNHKRGQKERKEGTAKQPENSEQGSTSWFLLI